LPGDDLASDFNLAPRSVIMKVRHLVLIVLLVGGFWYFTSHRPPTRLPLPGDAPNIDRSPLELTEAHAAPAYDSEELSNIAVYKKALPSVVNVTSSAVAYDFFYGAVPQQGQGTGFILDKQGRILTNFHVILANARQIEVTLDDKHKYKAKLIGSDQAHDLALLQIQAPDLTPATLSDSRGLVVGQKVYAIGNPFGLNGTMTTGIISSIRSVRGPQGALIENAIQTDAAINPGNSGGPLLNSRGEVIGITSMIASNGADQNSGIGFAIPINTAKAVLEDFSKYGHVRRPSLGIVPLAIGPDLAEQMGLAADSGVLILRIVPGGAAEKAGLRGGRERAYLGNTEIFLGGDLIIGIDDQQVTSPQELSEIMNKHEVGDSVVVTFLRGQRRLTAKLVLGDSPGSET
jgi:S1-C subfamily serine protease